ncbi:putative nuclease HARBI1 [Harpegnathos saltator]|uniref:putative nuclease HARBI1 n=1 Tax=Harpegnathos saltator TaxID=610380 RepID=UPI000DBEE713|nr:putative nuclease HARBI1 [Harpegnathos saltator]XP_025158262.1 putative nuclease HARBI1 [Harpegnathos saltator]
MALDYLAWELGLVVERVRRLERRVARRQLRDAQNPFHIPRDEFIDYFRLTPELVIDIAAALRIDLHNERLTGLVPEIKVLIAIQFYAQGSYQRSVGNQFQWIVSQSTTSRCLHAVTEAINRRLLRRWVKFPMTEENRQQARAKFSATFYSFESAIAAIDCTFIHIIAPHENEEAFINHHDHHSLNVQAIVDPDMKLLNINPRYPGARNDSYIWSTSPIRRAIEFHYNRGERKTWLIGDAGYPLEPWLMIPLVDFPEKLEAPIAADNGEYENTGLIDNEDLHQRGPRALAQRIQRQIMRERFPNYRDAQDEEPAEND